MYNETWKKAQLACSVADLATAAYWLIDDDRLWKARELANQVFEELIEEAKKED